MLEEAKNAARLLRSWGDRCIDSANPCPGEESFYRNTIIKKTLL